MISNAIIYTLSPGFKFDLATVEQALAGAEFMPCTPSQEKSAGWVPPRGEERGAFVECIGGHAVAKLLVETKAVPAEAVRLRVDELCRAQEQRRGFTPGKKERRMLKEEVKFELLKQAFPRQAATLVWFDLKTRRLVVDASTQGKGDDVVTALIEQIEGLQLTLLQTQHSAAASMSEWLLTQDPPAGFSIDRECELKATDDSKATVRYAKHQLDIDEIRGHIESGKAPTKLAITWNDRVSFVLNDRLQLHRIQFLESIFDTAGSAKEDGFDADLAIATGELAGLIPDLVAALGGDVVLS